MYFIRIYYSLVVYFSSELQFIDAQDILKEDNSVTSHRRSPSQLLGWKIVYCGYCGSTVSASIPDIIHTQFVPISL